MLSVCINVKNRSRLTVGNHELRLFPRCVDSLRRSVREGPVTELIVVDWQSSDWPLAEWLAQAASPMKLRVVEAAGPFSRGAGRNMAGNVASAQYLFFLDADCTVSREVITRGIVHLKQDKAFFPVLYSYSNPEHSDGWWRDTGYGNCMVTRAAFDASGGWPEYVGWGREDDQFFSRVSALAEVVRDRVPGFFHQWHPDDLCWKDRDIDAGEPFEFTTQTTKAMKEIESLLTGEEVFILVDEAQLDAGSLTDRALPFLEKNGQYWGPPPDDQTAISELDRLRRSGIRFIAFAWPAFWWLQHFQTLNRYLRCSHDCVLENSRLVVFDMG